MKSIMINRGGIIAHFPLTLVHAVVDTGAGDLQDALMLDGFIFDAVNEFTGDELAAETINFLMIEGEVELEVEQDGDGFTWKIEA
jgi:hypothetical protein